MSFVPYEDEDIISISARFFKELLSFREYLLILLLV